MTASQLAAGFADPARDSQAVFRAVMQAMARPGSIGVLSPLPSSPEPLSPGCAAVAMTLCDPDTPVWLDPVLANAPEVGRFLRFHTGAPIIDRPQDAVFALVADPARLPPFDAFALGTLDDPDRSTTLVFAVDTLDESSGWRLAGPGIDGEARLSATPLPADFAQRRGRLAPLFPRGLDIVLVAGHRVAALPRSTRLDGEGR